MIAGKIISIFNLFFVKKNIFPNYISNFRAASLSTYHRYECKIMDFLIASGMSIVCFLAYKAICQKPLQFFLDQRDKFQTHDEASGVQIALDDDGKPKEKYLSNDYRNSDFFEQTKLWTLGFYLSCLKLI